MNCTKCEEPNLLLLKEGEYSTGYFCKYCGYGSLDYYSTCCANQSLIDIRFEQANKTVVQRTACTNCKALIGGAKKKWADFAALRFYSQESYKEHEEKKSLSHKKLFNHIQALQDNFRRDQQENWWQKYQEHLKSDRWKIIRNLVLKRESSICQGCKQAEAVHIHHLTYENMGDELLFQLVALCLKCHQKLHPDKTL